MDIIETIMKSKWRWAGHVMRRTDGRWTKRITDWYPRLGSRKRGDLRGDGTRSWWLTTDRAGDGMRPTGNSGRISERGSSSNGAIKKPVKVIKVIFLYRSPLMFLYVLYNSVDLYLASESIYENWS